MTIGQRRQRQPDGHTESVIEAQTVINDWEDIYNHQRPHSSHGWRTPAAFAAPVTEGAQQRPQLSLRRLDRQAGPVTWLTALSAND